jgi:hypothetical protein
MKFRRISAVAAAGVTAVGLLVGVIGGGTASAGLMTPTPLCIDNSTVGNVCLDNLGTGNNTGWSAFNSAEVEWSYPNNKTLTGAIVSNAATCLQLNASGGDIVRQAVCNGDDAEMWTNFANPKTGRTEFLSFWGVSDDGGTLLCLSEDYNNGDRLVKADPCSPGGGSNFWYQQFGTS